MYLKQSTAATIVLGPFVDDTDGKTAKTSLTISQSDVRLSKNGGAFSQKSETSSCTHLEFGHYSCALNTTDTGTLGRLRVAVLETGALPVWLDFEIVPSNVWDSLFSTDKLQVHVDEMTANIITAAVLASDVTTELQSGLATASALSTVAGYLDTEVAAILANTSELQTDWVNGGRLDLLVDAIKAKTDTIAAAPAASAIADAVWDEALSGHTSAGTAGKALDDAGGAGASAADIADAVWDEALSGHSTAGTAGLALSGASAPSAGTVADAVWDEALSGHSTLGSAGKALASAGAAADPWDTALPGSYTSGKAGYILGTNLDQKISLTNSSPGSGAITFVYTLTEYGTGTPIAGADIWATSDSNGNTVLASGQTDASGEVTFYLDAGTVYIWRQKAGWNFTNPQSATVA